ncbi:UBP-type zinc finger domain-containing protein [Aurantibacter sp.]|uniref:UBP-type zinc finger domain-containing protein n=1 Tax=Aurantibacter sp. TaxID=2807103 RepID=UPI003265A553
MPQSSCKHNTAISEIKTAKEHVCEECVRLGEGWVHLRTCQECGVTLFCDDSKNKHATAHYHSKDHSTDHPVISSAEQNERWLWCYVDEAVITY